MSDKTLSMSMFANKEGYQEAVIEKLSGYIGDLETRITTLENALNECANQLKGTTIELGWGTDCGANKYRAIANNKG